MTKTLFIILVTMGIISSKQSQGTGVGMGSRSQDFLGISCSTVFIKSSVTNSAKTVPEKSTGLVGLSVRVKAASDLFNLMPRDFIKLFRTRLRGNI